VTLGLGPEGPGPFANPRRLGPQSGVVHQFFHIPQPIDELPEVPARKGSGQIVERLLGPLRRRERRIERVRQ